MKSMLLKHFDEFVADLRKQLESDDQWYGATWAHRPKDGQEDRVFARFKDYYDQWKFTGVPLPWLMVCRNAYIAWVRENHPEEIIND